LFALSINAGQKVCTMMISVSVTWWLCLAASLESRPVAYLHRHRRRCPPQ
jgi:hypothetical protein